MSSFQVMLFFGILGAIVAILFFIMLSTGLSVQFQVGDLLHFKATMAVLVKLQTSITKMYS